VVRGATEGLTNTQINEGSVPIRLSLITETRCCFHRLWANELHSGLVNLESAFTQKHRIVLCV
jgi:hypothetical protein